MAALSLFLGALLLACVSQLLFLKSAVENVAQKSFFAAENPDGFVEQDARSTRLKLFGRELPDKLRKSAPSLAKAIELCHWVRRQQPDGVSWEPHKISLTDRLHGDLDDPSAILQAQRAGAPAVCRQFAYLMVGATESAGMRARVVVVARTFWKSYDDGHVMAEVWIPEFHAWVLLDPMSDFLYQVDGQPASAVQVFEAVHQGRVDAISILRHDSFSGVLDKALLVRRFTHLYISLTNGLFDGFHVCAFCDKPIRFAHLTDERSAPYPIRVKIFGLVAGIGSLAVGLLLSCVALMQVDAKRGEPKGQFNVGTWRICQEGGALRRIG